MARWFPDSSILVYALDPRFAHKQRTASALLAEMSRTGESIVSTQAIGEASNVLIRKLGWTATQLEPWMLSFDAWEIVSPSRAVLHQALGLHTAHSLAWWDSVMLSTAMVHQANIFWSEDLQHGRQFGGTLIQNPFL